MFEKHGSRGTERNSRRTVDIQDMWQFEVFHSCRRSEIANWFLLACTRRLDRDSRYVMPFRAIAASRVHSERSNFLLYVTIMNFLGAYITFAILIEWEVVVFWQTSGSIFNKVTRLPDGSAWLCSSNKIPCADRWLYGSIWPSFLLQSGIIEIVIFHNEHFSWGIWGFSYSFRMKYMNEK